MQVRADRTNCLSSGRWNRRSGVGGLASWLCLVLATSGCGLPTWSQMTGSRPEEPTPVVVVPEPVQPPAPPPENVPPPPPPEPEPEEVIAAFRSLPVHMINDSELVKLTSLKAGLETIQELDLHGSTVTRDGLKGLHQLTHLTRLDMRGVNLNSPEFAHIGAVKSLEELQLDGHLLNGAAAEHLRSLDKLRILRAERLQLPPLVWQDFLTSHPNLEVLQIDDSNLPDPLLTVVAKLGKLRELWISRAPITDVGLAALAPLESLETLILTECQIHGQGLRPSGSSGANAFRNLTHLNVARAPLDERGAKAIAQMKGLKALSIGGMHTMLDGHFQMIVKPLDHLEYLSCSHNTSLTGQAFSALAGHEHLKELQMDHCVRVDDLAFKFLSKCEALKFIDLGRTACTIQGVLAFKEKLPDVEIVGLE